MSISLAPELAPAVSFGLPRGIRELVRITEREPLVSIYLPGEPKAAQRQRQRLVTKGKLPFVSNYMPAETKSYQAMLRFVASRAMHGQKPVDKAVVVLITVTLSIPQSWSKKNQALAAKGEIRPTKRPDCDNFMRQLDALKGIVWRDDALIVDASIHKFYGESPSFRVDVWEWVVGLV